MKDGHPLDPLDGASAAAGRGPSPRYGSRLRLVRRIVAAGARELIPHGDRVGVRVHRLVEEDDLPTALGAGSDVRPDDVVEEPACAPCRAFRSEPASPFGERCGRGGRTRRSTRSIRAWASSRKAGTSTRTL